MKLSKSDKLFELANKLSQNTPEFFESKGSGKGNKATNRFICDLGELAQIAFGEDYSEQNICGDNSLAVDFYFPNEGTIVEVALGLKRPNSEFEKDMLKAILAKSLGHKVLKLDFISKPGGEKKCLQPGRKQMKDWLELNHSLTVRVRDLGG